MQRCTASLFGAVMLPLPRCPPALMAAPETSPYIFAPLSIALSKDSNNNAPAPLPGTKPAAVALIGRDAFSGSSLCL